MQIKSKNDFQFADIEEVIENLRGLIRINSTTGQAGERTDEAPLGVNINEAINFVLDLADDFDFRTKRLDGYSGWAEIGPEDAEEMIGILAHVDVVPVGDDWDYEPFDLTIDDGKMFGRGTNDDKGPAIASLYAMKAVNDSDYPLSRRIRLIIGGDEENGDWTDLERYKETEEIPTFAFSPDAMYPVIFAEKGILHTKINSDDLGSDKLVIESGTVPNIVPDKAQANYEGKEYKTEGIAAHAMEPEKGENALLKLGKVLKDEGIEHPYLDLLEIANNEGLNIVLSDDVSGDLTYNPSIAHLGEDGSYLISDIRYPVTLEADDIVNRIKESVEPLGYSVEVLSQVDPLYVEKDSELVTKLLDVYNEATDSNEGPIAIGGGTYARAFDNAVAFGILFPGEPDMCHKRNEYWKVEDLEANMSIIADAIAELAS